MVDHALFFLHDVPPYNDVQSSCVPQGEWRPEEPKAGKRAGTDRLAAGVACKVSRR